MLPSLLPHRSRRPRGEQHHVLLRRLRRPGRLPQQTALLPGHGLRRRPRRHRVRLFRVRHVGRDRGLHDQGLRQDRPGPPQVARRPLGPGHEGGCDGRIGRAIQRHRPGLLQALARNSAEEVVAVVGQTPAVHGGNWHVLGVGDGGCWDESTGRRHGIRERMEMLGLDDQLCWTSHGVLGDLWVLLLQTYIHIGIAPGAGLYMCHERTNRAKFCLLRTRLTYLNYMHQDSSCLSVSQPLGPGNVAVGGRLSAGKA